MENFNPKKEKLPAKVDSDVTFEMVAERFLYNHKVLSEMEKQRQAITGPLYKAYKLKNEEANRAMKPHEDFEQLCKDKLNEWLEAKFQMEQSNYLSAGTEEARRGAMMIWQPPKYSTPYGEMRTRETVELVIDDATQVPEHFRTIDEKRVKKALEAGLKVPGARLVHKIVAMPVVHEYERVEHVKAGE